MSSIGWGQVYVKRQSLPSEKLQISAYCKIAYSHCGAAGVDTQYCSDRIQKYKPEVAITRPIPRNLRWPSDALKPASALLRGLPLCSSCVNLSAFEPVQRPCCEHLMEAKVIILRTCIAENDLDWMKNMHLSLQDG